MPITVTPRGGPSLPSLGPILAGLTLDRPLPRALSARPAGAAGRAPDTQR